MNPYLLNHTNSLITPALVYYREILLDNTEQVIAVAGDPARLWPHVKTHKCLDVLKIQMEKGIRRFKCATIAEMEMVCAAGADAALLAMPPAGPTAMRMAALSAEYPNTQLFGIIDCEEHLAMYQDAARKTGETFSLLIDINMGMDRTGVPTPQAGALYRRAVAAPHVRMCGFHCYDGHRRESDRTLRQQMVDQGDREIFSLRRELAAEGIPVDIVVLGGSPAFPCHARYREEGVYYSPGTVFLHDNSYAELYPDLPMKPAAVIISRVLSHPGPGLFTLDVGCKGISTDYPMDSRAALINVRHCSPVIHSEEHWVFRMDEGFEEQVPDMNTLVYLIPQHICPCTVLYPSVLVAEQGEIVDEWTVTARDRRLRY